MKIFPHVLAVIYCCNFSTVTSVTLYDKSSLHKTSTNFTDLDKFSTEPLKDTIPPKSSEDTSSESSEVDEDVFHAKLNASAESSEIRDVINAKINTSNESLEIEKPNEPSEKKLLDMLQYTSLEEYYYDVLAEIYNNSFESEKNYAQLDKADSIEKQNKKPGMSHIEFNFDISEENILYNNSVGFTNYTSEVKPLGDLYNISVDSPDNYVQFGIAVAQALQNTIEKQNKHLTTDIENKTTASTNHWIDISEAKLFANKSIDLTQYISETESSVGSDDLYNITAETTPEKYVEFGVAVAHALLKSIETENASMGEENKPATFNSTKSSVDFSEEKLSGNKSVDLSQYVSEVESSSTDLYNITAETVPEKYVEFGIAVAQALLKSIRNENESMGEENEKAVLVSTNSLIDISEGNFFGNKSDELRQFISEAKSSFNASADLYNITAETVPEKYVQFGVAVAQALQKSLEKQNYTELEDYLNNTTVFPFQSSFANISEEESLTVLSAVEEYVEKLVELRSKLIERQTEVENEIKIFQNQKVCQAPCVCSLQKWTVNIKELWGDNVISPEFADVNYCQGNCGQRYRNLATNNLLMRSVFNSHKDQMHKEFHSARKELAPTYLPKAKCVPKTYESISVLMLRNDFKTELKTFHNFTATSCVCV